MFESLPTVLFQNITYIGVYRKKIALIIYTIYTKLILTVAGHPCRNIYNGLKSNYSFSPSRFVVLLSNKKHFNQNLLLLIFFFASAYLIEVISLGVPCISTVINLELIKYHHHSIH